MSQLTCKKAFITVLGLAAATLSSHADLLFDRGLPTANLNNAAGPDRSNVAWADSETTASPTEYYLPGDNFALSGTGLFQVDTIRLWTTGTSNSLSLQGGVHGGPIGAVSSTYSAAPVTYGNATSYQQFGGASVPLYEVDFSVNLTLSAGTTYDFFLDSPFVFNGSDFEDNNVHSSNAALSGSPQEGADNTFLWLHINGAGQTVETWTSGDGTGTTGFTAGWDKNSDANVQVFGTAAVPEPGPLALISCSLLLLPFSKSLRMKFQKRFQA